jgi:hypothetical protein
MPSAVTDHRSWSVTCRARLVVECDHVDELEPPDVTSTSAAEAAFRERGWLLSADGTAACGVCRDVFSGMVPVKLRGSTTGDVTYDERVVDEPDPLAIFAEDTEVES